MKYSKELEKTFYMSNDFELESLELEDDIKTFGQFIKEKFDHDVIMSVDAIEAGDFVDFGEYGNLYVTGETKNTYKVTDDVSKRFKEGDFEIEKDFALKVIDKGDNFQTDTTF